jgi:hypothetical protein
MPSGRVSGHKPENVSGLVAFGYHAVHKHRKYGASGLPNIRMPAQAPAFAGKAIKDRMKLAGGLRVVVEFAWTAILQKLLGDQPGILA